MKTCPDCQQTLPRDAFPRRRGGGVYAYCRPCERVRSRERCRQYRERHLAKVRDRQRVHARSKNGWTAAMAAQALEEQGGLCDICHEPIDADTCHADHDHATGLARGLLCRFCNSGLGYFRDDPSRLTGAINYLQHHATNQKAGQP